jgi:hypothetical protein
VAARSTGRHDRDHPVRSRSLLGLEPVDHVAARQGMGRIWSARAHTRPGRSFRFHSENTRCATGVRRRGRPRFPVSEISRHSNGEPACAIRCTGRTPRGRGRAARRITDCRSPNHGAAAGAALAALAVAVAWFGIRINAWYGGTLGAPPEASTLLSGLSVSADVLALILPTAARTLWTDRRCMAAAIAWALWTITIAVALMATIGFAALDIADMTAARLAARIERLRSARGGITESRSVAAIEVELQRTQPGAATVWRATAGCRDVTLPASEEVCAPVLALRQAQATAERRDVLDADLREAESQLRLLPSWPPTRRPTPRPG